MTNMTEELRTAINNLESVRDVIRRGVDLICHPKDKEIFWGFADEGYNVLKETLKALLKAETER